MKRPDSKTDGAEAGDADRRYAVDWAHRAGAVGELLGELDRRSCRRRFLRASGMGGLVVMFLAAGVVWRSTQPPGEIRPLATPAMVALPPRQVLPDGSVVELNKGADIALAFTASSRRVVLRRGEAHFQVAKDPLRPFVVEVGKLEVRAIGTVFSVQWNQASAEVLVTEGKVAVEIPAVTDRAGSGSAPTLPRNVAWVEAGNRVVVDAAAAKIVPAAVEVLPAQEIARRLAWRVPRLEFSGTPLAEAVALFNRYNEVQFRLEEAALGDLRISGFLRADKVETFVGLLESEFALHADRRAEHEIVLRRGR